MIRIIETAAADDPEANVGQLRFDGKVAVVTGAGGGVGRTHALMLAARGAAVVVNDLGVELGGARPAADAVVAEIRARGGVAVADRHDVVDGAAVVQTGLDAYGRLDIVVNNAAVTRGGPIADPAHAGDWARTIATTVDGSIAVTRAAWPHLVAAGGGRIVMTSSGAMFGAPGSAAYSTAKSALYGLTKSLHGEGRADGIVVNCVMPVAWTRLSARLPPGPVATAFERHFPPEAVSSLVVWLCHATCPVQGEVLTVGGGRAARVFLAETKGVQVDEHVPEAWVGSDGELLDASEFDIHRDLADRWASRHLGGPGTAE
jgi:NAD(P)-dependent dehydrogenase (short-subunit alcohol dehydrogenase family)